MTVSVLLRLISMTLPKIAMQKSQLQITNVVAEIGDLQKEPSHGIAHAKGGPVIESVCHLNKTRWTHNASTLRHSLHLTHAHSQYNPGRCTSKWTYITEKLSWWRKFELQRPDARKKSFKFTILFKLITIRSLGSCPNASSLFYI